jgi:hypothetical protein
LNGGGDLNHPLSVFRPLLIGATRELLCLWIMYEEDIVEKKAVKFERLTFCVMCYVLWLRSDLSSF